MRHARSLCLITVALALHAPALLACDVVGRVDGLLLNNAKATTLDLAQMSIGRGNATLKVDDGMPVCDDDVITAKTGVVAIVRMGEDAEKDNAVTLYGEASITVENSRGILATLGRLFLLLRNDFDVRTRSGTLGARGTQLELNTTAADVHVVQLEGNLEVKDAVGKQGRELRPLQELSVSAGTSAEPKTLDPKTCASVLDGHSSVVSTTRPELPFEASGRDADKQNIASDFAYARKELLCQKSPEAAPRLAKAWANYAEPGGVLKLKDRVPPSGRGRDAALYFNSVGNAYRQAGWSNEALSWYGRALQAYEQLAFPYNGSGDAHRDLALVAIDAKNNETARAEFDLAEQAYRKSLDRTLEGKEGGINRAIPKVNLGELALLRISLKPDQAPALIDSAAQWFADAQTDGGPRFVFAKLGQARVDLMRAVTIPDVTVTGPTGWDLLAQQLLVDVATRAARRPHLDAARDKLRELIRDHPDFSAAVLLLGEVSWVAEKARDAEDNFRQAIRFDPHNVVAYKRLAKVVRRQERDLYEDAFRTAAPPALVPILQGRVRAQETAKPPAEIRDVRALSPSVPAVVFGFDYKENSPLPVTFTNTGTATVTVANLSIEGADASMFLLDRSGCANRQLAPSNGCTVTVKFQGDRTQARKARLVVGSSSGMEAKVRLEAPGHTAGEP